MNRAFIDANVIIRLFTGDPPEMAEQADKLFRRVDEGDVELVVDSVAVAEIVWVLSSYYGYEVKEVANVIRAFLLRDGIVGDEKLEILQALTLYEEKNIDFVDAMLAAKMSRCGIRHIYSFDRHFDRLESIVRISPSEV